MANLHASSNLMPFGLLLILSMSFSFLVKTTSTVKLISHMMSSVKQEFRHNEGLFDTPSLREYNPLMKPSDLLDKQVIITNLRAKEKSGALREIVGLLYKAGKITDQKA